MDFQSKGGRLASFFTLASLATVATSGAGMGCAAGALTAPLVKAPEMPADGQTKCSVVNSHEEPLVVEWPMASRGKLEAVAHREVVPVRYEGCTMHILSGCRAKATYKYTPITTKHGHVAIRNDDDLYANLPVGAANLEATLKRTGALDVDMMLVGRWESDDLDVRRDELSGDCDGVTHVVTGAAVGAFVFTAGGGASASASGNVLAAKAGGASSSSVETLSADGDTTACAKSTLADGHPPDGCGAFIRIEVTPVRDAGASSAPSAVTPASVPATVPAATAPPAAAASPTPSPSPGAACPAGQHRDAFRGCVPDAWGHSLSAPP